MKILISDNAKSAIGNIYRYSLNISTKYARKTVNNIYNTIFNIKDYPYIGRYVLEIPNKHFRERIYKEFRIIYYISEIKNTVYIYYIFSGKQNSNLFFKIHKTELINFLNSNFY